MYSNNPDVYLELSLYDKRQENVYIELSFRNTDNKCYSLCIDHNSNRLSNEHGELMSITNQQIFSMLDEFFTKEF
jgi:hypothetical protein